MLDNRARHFAEFIHDLGDGLADPIEPDTATDLLWMFSNEELWRELVEERGWSPTSTSGGSRPPSSPS